MKERNQYNHSEYSAIFGSDHIEININETSLQQCLATKSSASIQSEYSDLKRVFCNSNSKSCLKQRHRMKPQIVMAESIVLEGRQSTYFQGVKLDEKTNKRLKSSEETYQMCQSQTVFQIQNNKQKPEKIAELMRLVVLLKQLKQNLSSEMSQQLQIMANFIEQSKLQIDNKLSFLINCDSKSRSKIIITTLFKENEDIKLHNQKLLANSDQILSQFNTKVSQMSINLKVAERELMNLRKDKSELQAKLIHKQSLLLIVDNQRQKLISRNNQLIKNASKLKQNSRPKQQTVKLMPLSNHQQKQSSSPRSNVTTDEISDGLIINMAGLRHKQPLYGNMSLKLLPIYGDSLTLDSEYKVAQTGKSYFQNKYIDRSDQIQLERDNSIYRTTGKEERVIKPKFTLPEHSSRYGVVQKPIQINKFLSKQNQKDCSAKILQSHYLAKNSYSGNNPEGKEAHAIQSIFNSQVHGNGLNLQKRFKMSSNESNRNIQEVELAQKNQIQLIKNRIKKLKVQLQSDIRREQS